MISGKQR